MKAIKPSGLRSKTRILGERTFAAITAVEGIKLSKESKGRLTSLKRSGLSHDERRAEIIRAYAGAKGKKR